MIGIAFFPAFPHSESTDTPNDLTLTNMNIKNKNICLLSDDGVVIHWSRKPHGKDHFAVFSNSTHITKSHHMNILRLVLVKHSVINTINIYAINCN